MQRRPMSCFVCGVRPMPKSSLSNPVRSCWRRWIPTATRRRCAALAKAGVTAFAMELMPRITRAQSMDVLSSQANLAGYQAVIEASHVFDRAMPMMMTAAGTVPAAKVFVMGAGVAGLQAIATARRLGAAVSATDVRPAAKEQVASLGAKFIAVEDDEFKAAETAGGYAKEMSKEYQAKQAALVADHISKQDIVITTALIPGRPAPKLISRTCSRACVWARSRSISRSSVAAISKAPSLVRNSDGRWSDRDRHSQHARPDRGKRITSLCEEPADLP
jgi:NAD/NADP transhydrogenase alpha subunit